MQIDRKLNLVVPIDRADGRLYVHATPLSLDVFERYHRPLAKTFSGIYGEGLSAIAGPRIAAMMLKDVSIVLGLWDGEGGVQQGLMAEIRRLSNVILPGENGWTVTPLQTALERKQLSQDEVSEVENVIVFFIVASAMHKKSDLDAVLNGGLVKLWDAQISSSNCTEFAASLRTSTPGGTTGAKPGRKGKTSSVPV